jgi:hypothetical protein
MQLKISKSFAAKVQARYDRFQIEVGILEDGPHKLARVGQRGLKGKDVVSSYAGGPVRKKSSKDSGLTISQVSAANRDRLGFNYLTEPFQQRNSEIVRFAHSFFQMASGRASSMRRRVENLLQAIVRNPILRGDYGSNSVLTKRIKGFDRKMIDTAQLFKSIKARVKSV